MKQLAIIGCSMGKREQLTVEALRRLESAELVMGSRRLVDALAFPGQHTHYAITSVDIQKHMDNWNGNSAVVLVSGDTGFFSAAEQYRHLAGVDVICYPGISSLQAFCARLGMGWENVRFLSMHGRNCNLIQEVSTHEWVFCLTGNNLPEIGSLLCEYGYNDLEIVVGENLMLENEFIFHEKAINLLEKQFGSLSVLLIHNPNAYQGVPVGIPDADFIRGSVPMTKQHVRTLVISLLRLKRDSISWDIGGGSGSVSVEMALQSPMGKVYSVECNPEAIRLMQQNRLRFRTDGLEIIEGMAPDVLSDLPVPDCVFLGGTKGSAEAILQYALKQNPEVRVVATAVSLESIREFSELFQNYFTNAEITQIQIANASPIGEYHLMQGQNPVFIFSGGGTIWRGL